MGGFSGGSLMIEAALMGGALPGPWSAWDFVGSTSLLASGATTAEAKFPAGVQPGDLVVTIMSPLNETIRTTMSAGGWKHWSKATKTTSAQHAMSLVSLLLPIHERHQTRYSFQFWPSEPGLVQRKTRGTCLSRSTGSCDHATAKRLVACRGGHPENN